MKSLIAGIVSVVLFLISFAVTSGQDITYQLVNYPADQIDQYTSQPDTISGSITTDGMVGVISSSDILSWSASIENSIGQEGSFSANDIYAPQAMLVATSNQLIVDYDDYLVLIGPDGFDLGDSPENGELLWSGDDEPAYDGVIETPETVKWIDQSEWVAPSPWVIAQVVPEPSTIALLVVALLLFQCKWLGTSATTDKVELLGTQII